LQNSEALTNANRNLSNNLNVKRTPVASAALGWSVELGFEVFEVFRRHPKGELTVFGRYDDFDSMYKTQGQVVDNPRWDRSIVTFGLNYQPIPQIVLKSQYSVEKLGIPTGNLQKTYSVGIGFHIH